MAIRRGWIGLVILVLASTALADTRLARDTPQVWNVSTDAAVIAWFISGDDAKGEVEYGPTTDYGQTATADTKAWPLRESGDALYRSVAKISGLKPRTKYFYRIKSAGKTLTPDDAKAEFYFTTAPAADDAGPIVFAVEGDSGEGNKYQRAISYQLEQVPFDFMLHTGDVVYDDSTDAEWSLHYYAIYHRMIRNRPWFLSLGNHEYLVPPEQVVVSPEFALKGQRIFNIKDFDALEKKDPNPLRFKPQKPGTAAAYLENAILPEGPDGEKYYSFDWGPVHVVVLDSNRNYTPGKPGDKQLKWLDEDLGKTKQPWKVIAFHHPMTSLGKPAYIYTVEGITAYRRDWHPIFEKHGVDVVFAGHDHTYQRSLPVVVNPETGEITRDDAKGVVHIITGGGGGGLSDQTVFPVPAWHSGVYHKRHHFLTVKADGNEMTITAIGDDNINKPGVSEKEGVGGPAEQLDTVTLKRRGK